MLQIAVLAVAYKIISSLALLISSNLQYRKMNFFLIDFCPLAIFFNCKHKETLFVEYLVISTQCCLVTNCMLRRWMARVAFLIHDTLSLAYK